MKPKNIFLTLSLIAFAIGFSDAGESVFWYMGRPVGAILLMLFMIFNLLEKETALLDEQNRMNSVGEKSAPVEEKTKRVYGSLQKGSA